MGEEGNSDTTSSHQEVQICQCDSYRWFSINTVVMFKFGKPECFRDITVCMLLIDVYLSICCRFLGGLSLHLNHLIASCMANYNWSFGTLPFRLFGSNVDTRDLETYPRTYSGHF